MTQTTAEARDLVARVRGALDLASLTPPRGLLTRVFGEMNKKLSLGRGAVPYALADSIGFLCAYGYVERALPASIPLGEINPLTWDLDYSYVREAIHTSYFFAVRAGNAEGAAQLEPYLALPGARQLQNGDGSFAPNEYVTSGSGLALPFESPDAHPDHPARLEDRLATSGVMDLRMLATMWIFGGSDEWPRERIMAQVDSTIANLHKLKGWEPW